MRAALYRIFNSAGQLLYVGVANRPEERLTSHAGSRRWWHEVAETRVEWHPSREDAEKAEAVAINFENPLYNIAIPELDGSGKSRMRYDAPAIAWSHGDPNYRSRYRLRREARERAAAEASRMAASG